MLTNYEQKTAKNRFFIGKFGQKNNPSKCWAYLLYDSIRVNNICS